MKVLHINSYYSSSKFYKNLYDQQVNTGLDISVFVPTPSSVDNICEFGEYTTISVNHSRYDRFIFHLKHAKILKDITKRYDIEKYTLIHAHSLFSNGYIAMRLKKQFEIPYIVAVRNTDVNLFFKEMVHLRKLGVRILQNADKVIFLSKSYRDSVIDKYVPKAIQEVILDKSEIIPNGIDEFWFDNTESVKQVPEKYYLRLLQIGDINKNKNIETTVSAIKLLLEKGYEAKLDVVGKVKDQKVFGKIKDEKFVNYLGYKTKEELIQIYRDNDIFIMPSIHESFGLVYAEAMSQGLPLIYTRGQGFDGQFEDGEVGYCADCNNAIEIAEKIVKIVDNYNKISIRCQDKSKKFKWDMIVKQYQKIYQLICTDE